MPKYCFHCDICDEDSVRIMDVSEVDSAECRECLGPLRRTPKPPTSTVMETLDNGYMAKAVERPADAERLCHERARINPLKD